MEKLQTTLSASEQKALADILGFVIYINDDMGLDCQDENNLCRKVIGSINDTLSVELEQSESETLKEILLFGAEHMASAYGYDDDPSDTNRVQAQIDICEKLIAIL